MAVDEVVAVDAKKQNLALVPVVNGEQGSQPRWPGSRACAHVDRGLGEEQLTELCRASDDTGRYL
jgi:hypothetical protein